MKRTTYAALAMLPLLFNGPALAGPLNPLDYATYGPLVLTSGTAVLNTGGNPTLTANGIVYAGLVVNGVAVFDFSRIIIGQGSTLTGSGSLPVALLSRDSVAIGGTIDVSGTSVSSSSFLAAAGGSGGGAGGSGGNGGGPGGGTGALGTLGSGGGGFGGAGGSGGSYFGNHGFVGPGLPGGSAYGNLAASLQGGSGGGGFGGGGGGGIEIGALGRISFSQGGLIDADGGSANGGFFNPSSGGGSGGGIFLHASTFMFGSYATELSAVGGAGGRIQFNGGPNGGSGAAGGGGGGGRILVESTGDMLNGPLTNVAGGAGGSGASSGASGLVTLLSVPEPSSLLMLAIGAAGLFAGARVRAQAGRRG